MSLRISTGKQPKLWPNCCTAERMWSVCGQPDHGAEVGILLAGVGQIPSVEELEDSIAESFGEPVVLTVAYTPTLIVRYSDAEGRTELVPEE